MKRHNGSGKFASEAISGEEINPLDGVANLADVMLVFACGLMLALITFWNVDVAGVMSDSETELPPHELAETMDEVQNAESEEVDSEGLEEYGTVWRDQETGKLYIVTEGE